VQVNVDDSPKIQQRFEVQANPTLMVRQTGQAAARRSGRPANRSGDVGGLPTGEHDMRGGK
jgi:hypothetical protein